MIKNQQKQTQSRQQRAGYFMRHMVALVIATICSNLVFAQTACLPGYISTIAGNGSMSYSGDGGAAISAQLSQPYGVAVDGIGNVYIADQFNGRIRKVSTSGIITTLAGNGSFGYSGDGGAATDAKLSQPSGVAIDGSGNVYIADQRNNRIRKVSTSGTITTIAGDGSSGYGGDGGAATAAQLSQPSGVAIDGSGNVYIADQFNNRIRKVSTSGIITTLAGDGSSGYGGDGGAATAAQISEPAGVAIDGSGNVYIADQFNNCIRKVSTSGAITTIAGNGTPGYSGDSGAATAAKISEPAGVTIDGSGNVYIADQRNNRIRIVSTSGIINTLAGNGTRGYSGDGGAATLAEFFRPAGLAVDGNGNVYVTDNGNSVVRRIGIVGAISGIPNVCTGATTTLSDPTPGGTWSSSNTAVATIGSTGVLGGVAAGTTIISYIVNGACGNSASTVLVTVNTPPASITGATVVCAGSSITLSDATTGGTWSSSVTSIATIGSTGTVSGLAAGNVTISYMVGPGCGAVYPITVNTNPVVGTIATVVGNGTGSYSGDGGAALAAELGNPNGLTVDGNGNIYIADEDNHRIRKVTPSGIISTIAGNGTAGYTGDGGDATAAEINSPTGVAVDGSGNIYVAEFLNHRVRKINTAGIISTFAGNGTAGYTGDGGAATSAKLNNCAGVTVDVSGNVYIADEGNHIIRKVNTAGIITTIAGNGTLGFSGDGGAATAASLYHPTGVTVDISGNVYIPDADNHNVRKVNTSGIISTIAGNGIDGYTGDGSAATLAKLSKPNAVAIDGSGNIYIAEEGNHIIRKVTASGIISTIAGTGVQGFSGDNGDASAAQLNLPAGLAFGAGGNLYIVDDHNNRIRVIYSTAAITGNLTTCSGGTTTLSGTTPGGAWSSTNTGVATIGSTGVVSGVAAGTAIISYYFSCSSSLTTAVVTVTPGSAITGAIAVCAGSRITLSDTTLGGTWVSSNTGIATIGSTSGIVSGISAGTTIITYYSPGGCMGTVIETVNPAPTISAGSGVAICTGASTILSATGGVTYTWAPSATMSASTGASVTASPSVTTTYTVTGIAASGCSNTATVTVSVNPTPSLTSANNDGPICVGTTLHLSVTGASNVAGYSWSGPMAITTSTSATASVPSATTAASGTYTVTVSSSEGCTAQYTTAATVNPYPALTSANNDGPICAGTTLNLSVTGATDVTGYSWSGPVAITSSTSASSSVPSATTAASGTYTVTINNGSGTGCTARYTTTATVSPFPSLSSANNDGPICAGTTLHLSVSGASNVTGYSWSGPVAIATSSSAGASVPSATTAASGTYTVTVNNGSGTGCTAQYTTSATVNPFPALTSANNDGPICAGTTLNLSVTGATDVTGYSWSGPVAITSATSASASVPSATTAANGTYTVTINNGSGTGCTARYTTTATVSPFPSLSSANNDGPICAGTTLHLSVSGASNVTGYSWSGPVAITTSSSASASVPSATTAASGTYTVSVNNGSGTGCTAQYTTSATVNPFPALTSANNDGPICAGTTLNLSVTGATDVTGYSWRGPVAITSSTSASASVPSATTAASGTYTVTINNGSGTGCTARYTTTATVSPFPSLSSANNDGPICSGTTLHLSVSGASNVTGYSWSGPVAITTPTSASATVPSAGTDATGTYTVTINNGSGTGCITSYTTAAIVNPYPALTSANNDGPICAGFTLHLSVTGATDVTGYSWSGPVAITTPTSAAASVPSASTAASGTYTVTINNGTGIGCIAKYTTTAVVNPLPAAITGANTVCQNSTTALGETTLGGTWSSSNTAVGTISAAGVVGGVSAGTVILTYTTLHGCIGTKLMTVMPNTPITGPASVCSGTNALLASSTPGGLWSSSNNTIATVNCNLGIVNGLASGTSVITYSLSSGCFRTFTLSVITLLPNVGNNTLCTGSTTTLTNTIPGGVWTSNNALVATVGSTTGVVTGVAPGNVVIAYTVGNGCNATTGIAVSTLGANVGNANVCTGTTTLLANATVGGTWSTSDAAIANVGATTGIVSGVAAGNATITYTFGVGCYVTSQVSVNGTPSAVTAAGGGTFCGSTTITASGGTGGTIYFQGTTSGGTSTATASSSQVVTASGTYYFRSMSASGCWGTEGSVTVLIPSIVGPMNLCTGTAATLTNSGGTGTWMSSNTGVAGIGSTTGVVTAGTTGTTTITSTLSSGCVVTASMVVGAAPAITGSPTVCAGQTITLVNPAIGGTWSTSAPSTATVSSTGVVTGLAGGAVATISYIFNTGCRATYNVTVNPLGTISNIIGGATVLTTCVGQTENLMSSITGGTWVSTSSSVAVIGTNGVVTGIGAGTSLISYVMPTGCITSSPITVKPLSPVTGPSSVCVGQSITLSNATGGGTWTTSTPSIINLIAGNGIITGLAGNLVALVTYNLGSGCKATFNVSVNPLPAIGGVTSVCQGLTTTLTNTATGGIWSSANSSIASIGTTGIVSALSPGLVNISYVLPSGCTTTIPVNVNPVAPIGGPTRVCQGQTMTLTNSQAGTWSSGAIFVATIGSTGLVTGIATNSATAPITYTFCTGCKTTITVSVLPLSPIVGVSSVCQGQVITLTDASAGGTWSSSAAGIATFASTNGNVTGVSAGGATVSYALASGCTATFNLTVNPLSPITGPSSVCNGLSVTLANATPGGGTWYSPATSIATVSTSGVVTGATNGNLSTIISYTTPSGCSTTKTISVLPLSPIVGVTSVCQGQVITLTDANTGGTWSSSAAGIASFASTNGNVTGVSAGAATVSYALASGCTATFNVTVNPLSPITGPSSMCNGQSVTLSNTTPGGGIWFSPSSTIATVSSAGVVTGVTVLNLTAVISYTTPLGCRATYTVTVNAVPTVASLIGGPFAVSVSGAPITLTNTTAGGVWSSSNVAKATIGSTTGVVTGVSTGSAIMTYMVTNAAGCSAFVAKAITVGPVAPGHSSAAYNTVTIEEGTTIMVNESNPAGAWYCGDGEGIISLNQENGQVVGIAPGRAIVTYTFTDGVTTTLSTTRVIVNPKSVSVITPSVFASVMISPNPNTGDFTLTGSLLTLANEEVTLTVIDMLGQVVYSGTVNVQNNKLDERILLGNTIARGSYLLSLQTKSEKKVMKFVVE